MYTFPSKPMHTELTYIENKQIKDLSSKRKYRSKQLIVSTLQQIDNNGNNQLKASLTLSGSSFTI